MEKGHEHAFGPRKNNTGGRRCDRGPIKELPGQRVRPAVAKEAAILLATA